jgi:hypothetical protein
VLEHAATLFPSRVLAIYACHVRFPVLRVAPWMYKPVAVRSDSRSTLHGHVAREGSQRSISARRSGKFPIENVRDCMSRAYREGSIAVGVFHFV